MHADRFRPLLDARGPFVSIYFDDSHDTQDAATQLDTRWRDVRKELEEHSVDADVISGIEQEFLQARPPVGRSGRGLIAGADGVVLAEHLIRPPDSTTVRVSELAYIVPIVEHGDLHAAHLLVAVDHTGADFTWQRGDDVRSETVDGSGYPVHKASSAEDAGYGDPQRSAEAGQARNIRAVATRVTTLVDDMSPDVVFVLGEVRSRSDLLADLPERVAAKAVQLDVGARRSGVDDDEVRRAIETELQLRRVAVIDDAAQRFQAENGRQSGLAAEGLDAVCAALREGAVETLIIGDIGDATVVAGDDLAVVAPNPNVLSELGVAPSRTLRADEALPMLAVAVNAALVRTDERIDPADGVAAVLRYARPHN